MQSMHQCFKNSKMQKPLTLLKLKHSWQSSQTNTQENRVTNHYLLPDTVSEIGLLSVVPAEF